MLLGLEPLNSMTLKLTVQMDMTSTLKLWYPSKGRLALNVQYAYARIQSILRKADFKPEADANYSLNDAESWEIIKLIQDFPRIIKRAADNYEPSIIAKFAISLAQAFNKYYAHTRILDESPERDSRLALSYATAVVLKEALRLLGVEAPEKM